MAEHAPASADSQHTEVRQYSLAQILGVWAAAAVPMGLLAWVVAPLLEDQLEGDEPLAQALLMAITAGLIWQFVLVLILVRRELGTLRWSRVREALWLRSPRDPKTGRTGGRVWLWALLFLFLIALWQLVPGISGPSPRDFPEFLSTDEGKDFFRADGREPGPPTLESATSSTTVACTARPASCTCGSSSAETVPVVTRGVRPGSRRCG